MSPKRAPTARPGRDRFTAESYTVLGKSSLTRKERLKDQHHHLELSLTQQLFKLPLQRCVASLHSPQSL